MTGDACPPPPTERIDRPHEWMEAHAPLVRKVVARCAQRSWDRHIDIDDLFSMVCTRLIQNDYHALRAFRGQSTITTYLTVVTRRVLLDQRISNWGKWRPTARARALGATAVALERLVIRDGGLVDDALATLSRTSPGADIPVPFALELSARCKHRRRTFVPVDEAAHRADPAADPFARLVERSAWSQRSGVLRVVRSTIGQLSDREQLILRLRHREGLRVPEIAHRLGEDAKRLYRDLERTHRRLKALLESRGVSDHTVRMVLEPGSSDPPTL